MQRDIIQYVMFWISVLIQTQRIIKRGFDSAVQNTGIT